MCSDVFVIFSRVLVQLRGVNTGGGRRGLALLSKKKVLPKLYVLAYGKV